MYIQFTHTEGYPTAVNTDKIANIEIDQETQKTLIVLENGGIIPVEEDFQTVLNKLNNT